MNFFDYIEMSPVEFWEKYLEPGYVTVQHHPKFPLDIYAYGRRTVHEQKWDWVTSRCRGIIVNRDTSEVVSRPFEKFHNYGMESGCVSADDVNFSFIAPRVMEKLDGFMATLYTWEGTDYVASKGSFDSVHAKWATAWLRGKFGASLSIPSGYTAVFEGLHPDLRIVVDYKERKELVLLAVINNETGEELEPENLRAFAKVALVSVAEEFNLTLKQARLYTMGEGQSASEEGYVLTWYQNGKPPFRLKMKFIEYLRLHRMVTGVSPKRIWEVLATNQSTELDEYLKQSTPWFSAFVQKWMKALTAEYDRIHGEAHTRFQCVQIMLEEYSKRNWDKPAAIRKAYALKFGQPENKEFQAAMFAMLDGKSEQPIIWKQVKHMTNGKNPMVSNF